MASPPLSLRGIYGSLRAPTLRDVVFSSKAFIASVLALAAGFSLNLENPYWSVLTVYIIVNPPGAGAIRLKAIFRLLGTLIGGGLVLAAFGLFSDQIGILVAATIAIIVGAMFLNQIDKTPASYIWFAVAVTGAVIALSNLTKPTSIFDLATARVAEISLGILMTAAVDSFWPEPMTPAFLKTLAGWRGQARDFLAESTGPASITVSDDDRRKNLQELIKQIQAIDSKVIQLPFDVVARPPRRRDLDLVRRQVVAVTGALVAVELRARSLRHTGMIPAAAEGPLDSVAAWMRDDAELPAGELDRHVERGRWIADELERARAAFDGNVAQTALVERGLLSRLATFIEDWCDLLLAVRAVETGRRLPPRLARQAARAKPVRSIDYLATALDLAPLALALSTSSLIWYLTAWDSGPTALLFSFAGCIFLVGQGQILQSTAGFLACILVAFSLVFLYQFVVLPRVTDFPVLAMVLGCALMPLGILMTMSMAGMLIAALALSFLGLQNAYRADFAQSLQTLIGSLIGLLIAVICLRVCAYDHARFAERRLAAAVRRDILDAAGTGRMPPPGRFLSLALYRLALYFPAAEQIESNASNRRSALVSDLSIGSNLLDLRRRARAASPGAQHVIDALRNRVETSFRSRLAGREDDSALRAHVRAAIDDPAVLSDPAHDDLLDDLTGLDLALGDRAPRRLTPA